MKTPPLIIEKLSSERLILIPFTKQICENLLKEDDKDLLTLGLKKGKSWPDNDVMETLPKIIKNLSLVDSPTGFESWMIIKNDTFEIIGDAGFKGYQFENNSIDIGYGIIKGYAEEAATTLINWAFSTELVKEITARCALENLSSTNLLRKLRFIETKVDQEMMYWSLKRSI